MKILPIRVIRVISLVPFHRRQKKTGTQSARVPVWNFRFAACGA